MKIPKSLQVAALAALIGSAHADITVLDPSYSASGYYTHSNSDTIVSYDWSGGSLYYITNTSSFTFGGFYQHNGTTTTIAAGNSDFAGASVVTVGDYVYYNTSDFTTQKIFRYGALSGTPSLTLTSTAVNYSLAGHDGGLYITGAPGFGTNHIYHTNINSDDGTFLSTPPTDLGVDAGSSGPLTFDGAGNLYYAPGFSDPSIYKWSAAEVEASLENPITDPLSATGHKWLDYSLDYSAYVGGTSLLVDGDQLLLTLSSFSDPSELVAFGIGQSGASDGTSTVILDSSELLGELRSHDGGIYLSNGNSIYQLQAVPEPSSIALLIAGGVLLLVYGRRRKLIPVTIRQGRTLGLLAVLPLLGGVVNAGPFSPAADQPGSNGVAADAASIKGWATGVVNFTPGPVDITNPSGAKAGFGSAANTLGVSDSTPESPYQVASLGDGGSITLSFTSGIGNGPGADLAVFENAFPQDGVENSYFLELATVSVSSDGVNFFTFPSVSLTPTASQIAGFGTLDPTNLYNLAGAEIVGYGTPFNLDDLAGVSPLLNINSITQVRITDVIGNINTALGAGTYTTDDATNPIFHGLYGNANHVINDPYKTNFNAGGFDLDAVAVLNVVPEPLTWAYLMAGIGVLALYRSNRTTARS